MAREHRQQRLLHARRVFRVFRLDVVQDSGAVALDERLQGDDLLACKSSASSGDPVVEPQAEVTGLQLGQGFLVNRARAVLGRTSRCSVESLVVEDDEHTVAGEL